MEVEAPEKGHRAFAKALKIFSVLQSSTGDPRGLCLQLQFLQNFPPFSCGSAGKDAQNVIKRFLNCSYFDDIYASDASRYSDKTIEALKAKVKSNINKDVQPGRGAQSTLRKEILQLEKHLKDQQVVRGALEKALGPDTGPVNLPLENPMPKAANELIREIATLELEVKNMEQYLLTLYRKAFEQQAPAFSPPDHRGASKPSVSSRSGQLQETPMAKSCKIRGDAAFRSSYPPPHKSNDPLTDCCTTVRPNRAVDSDVLRCQSALSYRGVSSSRILPSEDDSLARALRSCHSQPFSFLEEGETGAAGMISLAEYLGTNVADHIPETPNNLSEEMEFSGPYNTMVEVPMISRDSSETERSRGTCSRRYKLILYRLETVDLRRMTNEEKIAFWVNIHNGLLMHAACKIAGRNINVAVIQSMILGCNTHCPGQWLRNLAYPRIKSKVSKAGHEWRAFAVAQSEPLLRFALCSGSHSDPAVRVYTPKRLFHQLEAAERGVHSGATAGVWKEQKLLLPKLVEAYAKDVKLSPQGLVDMGAALPPGEG
ncbi:hypothetical protein HU200_010838 [Digitaria exilis]|uniref:Ternary complex factor MIP1 leucine-zipper domain-containing protein n=1 Tax=Digitaria exilis TaxID=1010633 RepID=A0A835KN84_9POAL|nr:hypothetical protein HU200_010838 [Digitaria exilis]